VSSQSIHERAKNLTAKEAAAYLDKWVEIAPDKRPSLTGDPGIQAIILRGSYDTQFFGQTFMAESFGDAMTYQHKETWELIDDETIPRVAICAWRGFGKTTTYVARKVKDICYRYRKFIMLVGRSLDYASMITDNIKSEVIMNPRIRLCFGNMKAQAYEGVELSFSKKAFFLCDPVSGEPICFIVPKGAGQQVRGMNVRLGNQLIRCDDITIDDLEDDDEVNNEELRQGLRRWFHGALLNCVPRSRPNPGTGKWDLRPGQLPPWRIFYMDTLKHEDANIAHLLGSSHWKSVRFPQAERRKMGVNPDGSDKYEYFSLVPEIVSHSQVRREVREAVDSGTLDQYCMEKLCIPTAPEMASWTRDSFRYYFESESPTDIIRYVARTGKKPANMRELLNRSPEVDRFIIVDPARTAQSKSAYTAIMGVAAYCTEQKIYIRSLVNERLETDEILDAVFAMAVSLNTRTIAVEDTGLHMHIQHLFMNGARQRGLNIEWIWLKGNNLPRTGDYGTGKDAAKRARASMIVPYYRQGQVIHEESVKNSALEMQQLSFPKAARWDALDCAGYIPQVLQAGGRYFLPKPVVEGSTEKFQFEDSEDYGDLGRRIKNREFALN
jgi:hypothetical protein